MLLRISGVRTFFTLLSRNGKPMSTWEVNTKVAKDVILYRHDNTRLFKAVNFFAISVFITFNYVAQTFLTLKDVKVDTREDAAWWQKISLGEGKYKNTLAIASSVFGSGIAVAAFMYGLRSVRMIVLRKGGQSVSFVTYGPFGRDIVFTSPVDKVSAKASRHSASSSIPIKVQGKPLHFYVDTRGQFVHPAVFDSTVGLKRNLK